MQGRLDFQTQDIHSETITEFFHCRSEANDLALRLARQYTNHEDVIVLDQWVHWQFGGYKAQFWPTVRTFLKSSCSRKTVTRKLREVIFFPLFSICQPSPKSCGWALQHMTAVDTLEGGQQWPATMGREPQQWEVLGLLSCKRLPDRSHCNYNHLMGRSKKMGASVKMYGDRKKDLRCKFKPEEFWWDRKKCLLPWRVSNTRIGCLQSLETPFQSGYSETGPCSCSAVLWYCSGVPCCDFSHWWRQTSDRSCPSAYLILKKKSREY